MYGWIPSTDMGDSDISKRQARAQRTLIRTTLPHHKPLYTHLGKIDACKRRHPLHARHGHESKADVSPLPSFLECPLRIYTRILLHGSVVLLLALLVSSAHMRRTAGLESCESETLPDLLRCSTTRSSLSHPCEPLLGQTPRRSPTLSLSLSLSFSLP
ncbi:hypothetical protein LX36DRAFT_106272 [Colletotrichum falcatum]|nr:hypothetical protein LX36DRAFT_106272 [Colletotrichum falcatum]